VGFPYPGALPLAINISPLWGFHFGNILFLISIVTNRTFMYFYLFHFEIMDDLIPTSLRDEDDVVGNAGYWMLPISSIQDQLQFFQALWSSFFTVYKPYNDTRKGNGQT